MNRTETKALVTALDKLSKFLMPHYTAARKAGHMQTTAHYADLFERYSLAIMYALYGTSRPLEVFGDALWESFA